MSKTLKVFINGKPVGFATALEVDMPWFSARFTPSSSFAEFAPLFIRLDQAYDEKNYDVVNQLNDDINNLDICFEEEDGRLLLATDLKEKPVRKISTVRILGNQIMWRSASA